MATSSYQKEYYQAHKEKIRGYQDKYIKANREKVNSFAKKWYENHKDKMKARANEYYQNNKETVLAKAKQKREDMKAKKQIEAAKPKSLQESYPELYDLTRAATLQQIESKYTGVINQLNEAIKEATFDRDDKMFNIESIVAKRMRETLIQINGTPID